MALDFQEGIYSFHADFNTEKVGDFDTELVEVFRGLPAAQSAIFCQALDGSNSHHAISIFKALLRRLKWQYQLKGMTIYHQLKECFVYLSCH